MRRSRTSKTIIALLAVILVLLIRGTRRQRTLIRLLTGFTLANWFSDRAATIAGFFGGVAGDVRDYAVAIVQQVIDWATAGFSWVNTLVSNVTDLAWSLFDTASRMINRLVWEVYAVVSGWIQTARDFATGLFWSALSTVNGWIQSVYSTVNGWVWNAIQFAMTQAANVLSTALSFINTLIGNVTSFVWQIAAQLSNLSHQLFDGAVALLRSAIGDVVGLVQSVAGNLRSLLADLEHEVIGLITAAGSQLRDWANALVSAAVSAITAQVEQANRYLFGTVSAIVGAVSDVIDWIVALATFPFTFARDLWSAFRTAGGRTLIERAPDAVGRFGPALFDRAWQYKSADSVDYVLPQMAPRPGGDSGGDGGAVSPGSGTPDQLSFARELLAAIGAPATDSNLSFLLGWMRREGTSASFNPLATTLPFGSWSNFNAVGVKNYADFGTGVDATAATLLQSGYPTIVAALRAGDGHAAGQAHADLSKWSGGGYDTIPA